MGFLGQSEDDKQNGQDPAGGLQQPVTPGLSTREQMAAPTGGSTGPTNSGTATAGAAAAATGGAQAPGSAAPTSTPGNAQAAGKAPAWTNLMSFLGAQSDGEKASVTDSATAGANKAAAQATQAAGVATQGVNHDAAAGTDTGALQVDHSSPYKPVSGGVFSAPTYDFSKVNLAGYTGPSADTAVKRYGTAASSAVKAQDAATALQSGTPKHNAYDNALLTQTPAWGKVLGAVSGANSAAQDTTAQANGAFERVNQAQTASGANVAQQKGDLKTAGAAIDAAAGHTKDSMRQSASLLATGDLSSLEALKGQPATLQTLGLTPDILNKYEAGLRDGSLTPQNVAAQLKPYSDAASNATGYTPASAQQAGQVNDLLKTGAPAPTATKAGAGSTDPTAVAARNQQDLSDVASEYKRVKADGADVQVGTYGTFQATGDHLVSKHLTDAVKELLASGYTAEQIQQFTGIPATETKKLQG